MCVLVMTDPAEAGRKAYAQGRQDYRNGVAEARNPHNVESGLRPYWAAGWNFEYELKRSPYKVFT